MEMRDLSLQMMSDIVIFDKYARHIPSLNRRETWGEAVDRRRQMDLNKFGHIDGMAEAIEEAYRYVYEKKVVPSMRSLQFAGKAAEMNNFRMFNCCYAPFDHPDMFSELMFLLLGGSGVGYSVQKAHVKKLPKVIGPDPRERKFLIGDSCEGWSDAVKVLVEAYFYHKPNPRFDYRDIRRKGAVLVTSGGRAPGPDPLCRCLDAIRLILDGAIGRKLRPIEVHDIACHIAEAVRSGGIRRAAMISGFSMTDNEMIGCKGNFVVHRYVERPRLINSGTEEYTIEYTDSTGERKTKNVMFSMEFCAKDVEQMKRDGTCPWYHFEPQRALCNNSAVVLRHRITKAAFQNFWRMVQETGSGDPGLIFSNDYNWFYNPCGEAALPPYCACNLTEVNCEGVLTQEELNARVWAASFIGTLQAAYTDFHYLRPEWKETIDKEALLGVSLTGQASVDLKQFDLKEAAGVVLDTNAATSSRIGINQAARTTLGKPSGTAALALMTCSGCHAWFARYYIRRLTFGKSDAIYQYLKDVVPGLFEELLSDKTGQSVCLCIPMAAPEGAIIASEESPIEFLERVKYVYANWILPGHRTGDNTHNQSATVYVGDDEWEEVGSWMWENRAFYTGLSVLPKGGGTHIQTPFEEISQERYEELCQYLNRIDLTKVVEVIDSTTHHGEVACGAGGCEL